MSDQISTLALRVKSDAAVRDLDKFSQKTAALEGVAGRATKAVAGIFAVKTGINIGRDLLAAASDAQEAGGKFRAVFQYMAGDAQQCADELAKSFNFSKLKAQESLSTMADIFRKSGLSLQDSLRYAFDLNKQAADIEAFTNAEGGLEQVTHALTNVMLGFGMMAQHLGVVVHDEDVQERTALNTRLGLTFATERAAKMYARYQITMEQSASATGQVARESVNYANRLRKLKAGIVDLKQAFGDAIVGPATKVIEAFSGVVETTNALSQSTKNAVVGAVAASGAIGAVAVAVAPLVGAIKTYSAIQKISAATTRAQTASETANADAASASAASVAANSEAFAANATAVQSATTAREAALGAIGANVSALDAETAALERNAAARSGAIPGETAPIETNSGGKSGRRDGVDAKKTEFDPLEFDALTPTVGASAPGGPVPEHLKPRGGYATQKESDAARNWRTATLDDQWSQNEYERLQDEYATNRAASERVRRVRDRRATNRAAKIEWRASTVKERSTIDPSGFLNSRPLKTRLLEKRPDFKRKNVFARFGSEIGSRTNKAFSQTGASRALRNVGIDKIFGVSTLKKAFAPLGKATAPLQKIGSISAKLFAGIAKRLPLLSKCSGVFGSVGGFLGPVAAVGAAFVGTLEIFKNAPKWLEVFINEGIPKIKEFGAKMIPAIWEGAKNGISAAGKWAGDLIAGGLLGAGQTIKRLFGFETEASKTYRLEKERKALLAKREAILAAEKAANEAESAVLNARENIATRRRNAVVERATNGADDVFNLASAKGDLANDEETRRRREDELNGAQVGVAGANKSIAELTAQIGDDKIEIARINLDKSLSEEEKKTKKAEVEARTKTRQKTIADLTAKRDEYVEQVGNLQEELNGLADKWQEHGIAVDELTDAVVGAKDDFDADRRERDKAARESAKALEDYGVDKALDDARTDAARRAALQEKLGVQNKRIASAENAGVDAATLNDEIVATQAKLQDEEIAAALLKINEVAQSGDRSNASNAKFFAAIRTLQDKGVAGLENASTEGDAPLELYARLMRDRKNDGKSLEKKIAERDEKQAEADALSSLFGERDATNRELQELDRRSRERGRERGIAVAERNERFRERDKEFSDFRKERDSARRFSEAKNPEKMGLLADKRAAVASETSREATAQRAKIAEFSAALKILDAKYSDGTLDEEGKAERDRLIEKREKAEEKYYETRLKAAQENAGIEDRMNEVAKSWAQEQVEPLKKRWQERSEVAKEASRAVDGQRAIRAGSSEAFALTSRIYDRAQKTTQRSVEQIEKFSEQIVLNLARYLSEQQKPLTVKF